MLLTAHSRRFAPAALFLAAALLGAPAPAIAAEFAPGETAYTRSEVVLRDGGVRPVKDEIGRLPAGATALLIKRWRGPQSHWWKVTSDTQTGWVPESALTWELPANQEVAPSPAADAAAPAVTPAPAATRAEIERAIAKHKGRRSGAIAGYVAGGILIFAGVVKSVVDTDNEIDEKYDRGDYSETPLDYTGIAIGVAIAAPIFIASVNTHIDASRQLRTLYSKRSRLSVAPASGGAMVALNLEFGGR